MSALVEASEFSVAESASPLSFERAGPEMNPGWDRFLVLKGRRAFHIGNVCDTCEFFFERLEGADEKVSPAEIGERLRRGVARLDDQLVRALGRVLTEGEYRAILLELTPELVQPGAAADYFAHEQVDLWGIDSFWNLPHDPRTEYYRVDALPLGNGRQLFEFVVPMMPSNWLDGEATGGYEKRLQAQEYPTAFAISTLDVKQPAEWEGDPPITEHWCLAHYLLDGHHKMLAAARAQRPLRLLSFLAPAESIATEEDVAQALDILASVTT